MKKSNKILKKYLGYKDDKHKYKEFKDYSEYNDYCLENKLIAVSREEFIKNLKLSIDVEVANKVINNLHNGINIGKNREMFDLTLDEIHIIIDGCIIECKSFGTEYKG